MSEVRMNYIMGKMFYVEQGDRLCAYLQKAIWIICGIAIISFLIGNNLTDIIGFCCITASFVLSIVLFYVKRKMLRIQQAGIKRILASENAPLGRYSPDMRVLRTPAYLRRLK